MNIDYKNFFHAKGIIKSLNIPITYHALCKTGNGTMNKMLYNYCTQGSLLISNS